MRLFVNNSPFSAEQAEILNSLLPQLTAEQLQWLGGYLAFYRSSAQQAPLGETTGLSQTSLGEVQSAAIIPVSTAIAAGAAPAPQAAAKSSIPREATILFGSQTGNAQRLAAKLAKKLEDNGFSTTVSAMNKFKTNGLKKVQHLLILTSTHGEGEPPDNAISFHEFLYSKRAPKLDGMKFSVLALGDTSYEFFCKTGIDFDEQLEALGAERIVTRVDCDLDFDEPSASWIAAVTAALSGGAQEQSAGAAEAASASALLAPEEIKESQYSRSNPYLAEVLESINLSGRGSDRETRHLELSLEGSDLTYEPGDCLGVYAKNDPKLVDEIITMMNWDPNEQVLQGVAEEKGSLQAALTEQFEITVLTKPLLEKAAHFSKNEKLAELLLPDNIQELRSYTVGRDLLDLLQDFKPWSLAAEELIGILRKLPARLYSIASSNKANPDEVHLTIRKVEYEAHGRKRFGVCSAHVSERVELGDRLGVFVQQNPNFKLPANPDTPIIMIGPGTGVAPFRSFLEEREELGIEGKSWLFFGDRHFVTDFLYQTDWQRFLQDGVLTKLDVAFSRDTKEKVYVQHRILEHAAEVYQWLQEGAHVYICGDEKHMAHDVHQALLTVLEQEGGLSSEAAAAYLKELQEQQRYQRDVY